MSEAGFIPRLARQRLPLLLFFALTCFYLAWSPGTIEGQGYNKENIEAATALADKLMDAARGQAGPALLLTRHGGLEVLLELPLALLARLVSASPKLPGVLLSLLPVLCTALLAAVLFVWAERLSGSRRVALWLAVGAGVGTMLWPYAYIGLETSQSLFVLLAGWQVCGRIRTYRWPEALRLSLSCTAAVALKSTGVFLLPAIVFLLYCYFAPARRQLRPRQWWLRLAAVTLVIGALLASNQRLIAAFWRQHYGAADATFRSLLSDGVFDWALHFAGFFVMPNKSVFLYAPLLLPCVLALPASWRAHRRLTIFALLVLLGLSGGFALVQVWTEETWGPRYLHSAIAPLVLCWAATLNPAAQQEARKLRAGARAWLGAAVALGLLVSLLGTLFYYGKLAAAAERAGQNTLEALQYDPAWHHVRFNALLLGSWWRARSRGQAAPLLWPPAPHWWFERPAGVATTNPIDVSDLAVPAPLLLRPRGSGVGAAGRVYQMARWWAALLLLASALLLSHLDRACRLVDRGGGPAAQTEPLPAQQPA